MSGQWLTPEEVYALTEKRRWTAQCRVLAARKIRFIRAGAKADGRPLVNRAAVDADGKAAHRRDENRWDLIGPKAAIRNIGQ